VSIVLLALNAGSSSLKFAGHDRAGQWIVRGNLDRHAGRISAHDSAGNALLDAAIDAGVSQADALAAIARVLGTEPAVVAHRIVHGGERDRPARVDDVLVAELAVHAAQAPLHQPAGLALLAAARERWTAADHWACFDTAFHAHWDQLARCYAAPAAWVERGWRRWGYHGLAYAAVVDHLATLPDPPRRVLAAHLGSGASVCAIRDGRSVDASMGWSALDGLPMGTRSGSVDPALVLTLAREYGIDAAERMLWQDCGLAGLSGVSADVRTLAASADPRARLALALFARRTAQAIAGLAASIDGFDALVFSGGIGTHAPAVRALICAQLAHLGIRVDDAANAASRSRIDAHAAAVAVHVLDVDEQARMAREVLALR
jgi:acetate kinase